MSLRRRFLSVAVWLLILGLVSLLAQGQAESPVAWGPILGSVSETSIVLTWKTTRAVGLDIHYAEARTYDETGGWEETLSYEQHEGLAQFWLRGLRSGTSYRYRLVFFEGDAEYPTPVSTFRTLAPDLDTLVFAVYGATASVPDHHRVVAETILAESNAELVFHAGNMVEAPTEERLANFFWAMSRLGQGIPFLPVIGGRDAENDFYYDAFAPPSGGGTRSKQWWFLDAGPIRFVGLDSTVFARSDQHAIQEQTRWLEQILEGADQQIVVVFCADAVYSGTYRTGRYSAIADTWDPLFRKHGVGVVFSSSVRGYEHIYVQGIHYVNTGGGGAPAGPPAPSIAPGTVALRSSVLHYVRGTLSDGGLRIEAIPVATVTGSTLLASGTGQAMDAFTVRP